MGVVATEPGSRRRRLLPEARREEILDSATELISSVGFNAATVDDFARAAGISRPGLLHHFPSKEALLEAVLERRDEQDVGARSVLTKQADTPQSARLALTELVRRNMERPHIVQLYSILSAEALAPDHPAHQYFRRRLAAARSLFGEKLLAWHPTPDAAAVQVISFLDGIQLSWSRDPDIDFMAQWEMFADQIFPADDGQQTPAAEKK